MTEWIALWDRNRKRKIVERSIYSIWVIIQLCVTITHNNTEAISRDFSCRMKRGWVQTFTCTFVWMLDNCILRKMILVQIIYWWYNIKNFMKYHRSDIILSISRRNSQCIRKLFWKWIFFTRFIGRVSFDKRRKAQE